MQRLPARILLFRHILTNALMRIAMHLALLVPLSHLRLIQPKITPLRPFEAPGAASDNHRYEAPGPRIQKIRALFLLSGQRYRRESAINQETNNYISTKNYISTNNQVTADQKK